LLFLELRHGSFEVVGTDQPIMSVLGLFLCLGVGFAFGLGRVETGLNRFPILGRFVGNGALQRLSLAALASSSALARAMASSLNTSSPAFRDDAFWYSFTAAALSPRASAVLA
jgi:hypothetical protein